MEGATSPRKEGRRPQGRCLRTVLGGGLIEILDKLSKAWNTSDHGVRGQSPWAEVMAQITWVVSWHTDGPAASRCRQSSRFLFLL